MRCLRLEASALNGYLERWSFRSTEGMEDVLPDLSCELEQVLGSSGDVCMEELSADDLIHILGSPQDVCMPGELSHLSPLDIEQVLGIPEQGGLDNAPTVDDLTLSRILEAEFHFSSLEEKLDSFEADIIDILQQALQRHKTIQFFLQTEVELIKTNDASDLRYIRRFRSHFTAQPRPFQILCPRTVFVLLYRGRSGVKYRPQRNLSRRESGGKVLVEFILNSFKAKRTPQKISFRRYERATKNDFLNEQTCHICKKQLDIKTKTDLLRCKGVYPYEYMTDSSKFSETSLPPIEYFSSKLLNESCSNESYAFAQQVWEELNCTTLGDYHDIYLIGDVALLADIFQYFRDLCLRHYQLDPILIFSSPSLSLDAALKMTNVSLDLISDPDMYLTCEQIRGGVAMISKRYAKANNPFMGDEFSSSKDTSYLFYTDCNNIYGWSMCQPLPTGRFRWLTSEECNQIDILALQDDSPIGYIFVVDLCYPEHLHDSHNDFPLAPERLQIVESMLSDFQKSLPHSIASSIKLCPNFFPKSSYTVHYRTLKFYLSQGLILTKIHKIISFNQSPWLKPYIDFNTDQRKQAKSEFEKSFWKLLNNSVYGKTIENLRKRVRVEVVTEPERAAKLMGKPTLDSFHIIEEDLVILKMKKRNLTLNKPVYLGFTILELSKLKIFQFHYSTMLPLFKAPSFKISLCFTDTDSFLYHITTPPSADLFSILDKIRDQLDTSDYPLSHPLYSQVNEKVIGKWKDELCGQIMTEFVGLKAKMYSYRVLGGDEKNIGKGVKKHILKNELAS
ncbi:hypothetical protein LAZ67_5002690 [Cordylochernes scorpioides]|uniref:DNA-directed DNA polymerase n=1 Tax=Cordylochernes scorpioides TaxID=51811 RepID=A0ABY6KGK2_9ARAC|nr:hypothetical protein LAZ67_5002690 [Cordylochernes scorpioides]